MHKRMRQMARILRKWVLTSLEVKRSETVRKGAVRVSVCPREKRLKLRRTAENRDRSAWSATLSPNCDAPHRKLLLTAVAPLNIEAFNSNWRAGFCGSRGGVDYLRLPGGDQR